MKWTALTPLPTKEEKEVLPHRNHLITCTQCTQKVFILITVFTARAHIDKRKFIRKTWATDPSMKAGWTTMFLIGQAAGDNVQNEYLQAKI